MRIWYKEPIRLLNQPVEVETHLLGVFNEGSISGPLIEIIIHTSGDNQVYLYSHNPVVRYEDPSDEDIVRKYAAKLVKLRAKLCKTEYIKVFPTI